MSIAKSILIVWAIALSGCATLFDKRQIISVDSEPRGIDVSVNGYPRETTPYFIDIERAKKLHLRTFNLKETERFVLDCDARWLFTVGSNLPIGLLAMPSSLYFTPLGVALDFGTEAAYQCPSIAEFKAESAIQVEPATSNEKKQAVCLNILQFPMSGADGYSVAGLESHVGAQIKKTMNQCTTVKPSIEEAKLFDDLAIDGSKKLETEQLSRERWNKIGHDAEVSLAAVTDIEDKGEKLQLKTVILDLHTLKPVQEFASYIEGEEKTKLARGETLKTASKLARFLPNSVALSVSNYSIQMNATEDGVTEGDVSRSPWRSLGLSITNIDSPTRYGKWDAVGHIYAGINFFTLHKRLEDTPDAAGTFAPESTEFKSEGIYLPISAKATAHTPGGAFGLGIGLGPMFIRTEEIDVSPPEWNTVAVAHVEFSYVAFVNRSLFWGGTVNIMDSELPLRKIDPPIIKTEFLDSNTISYLSLFVGYHIPQTRSWLDRLL